MATVIDCGHCGLVEIEHGVSGLINDSCQIAKNALLHFTRSLPAQSQTTKPSCRLSRKSPVHDLDLSLHHHLPPSTNHLSSLQRHCSRHSESANELTSLATRTVKSKIDLLPLLSNPLRSWCHVGRKALNPVTASRDPDHRRDWQQWQWVCLALQTGSSLIVQRSVLHRLESLDWRTCVLQFKVFALGVALTEHSCLQK
jgi:hypothetical protein